MKKLLQQRIAYLMGLGMSFAAASAQAAIDVTAVTAATTDAATAVGVIGAAVLVVIVGVKAYKWIRGAL